MTVNVDVVRSEFEKLLRQAETVNDKAAQALEQTLRANFADGDGRLPRTLERFLGDRGALRSMVDELFDESKRDSAIGRIGSMLERYFDGDASKLALLLDPTRLNSPMHQFRQEMTAGFRSLEERLVAIEAAAAARGAERARSAAKGGDFEDLLEAMLADLARGAGDLLDRTGTEAGALMKSKKGDFVLTLDARVARGCDVRVVIEAKDRPMSMRAMRDELREARENRGAAVAVVVFTPAHAPSGVAPFNLVGDDVYCVIDPEAPEPATLEAAIRLARLLALASLVEHEVEVDAAAIAAALTAIREQLEAVRSLKAQLTSISTATKAVWTGLDTMRSNILARVIEAEAELRGAGRIGLDRTPDTMPRHDWDQGAVGARSTGGPPLVDAPPDRPLFLAVLVALPVVVPASAAEPLAPPAAEPATAPPPAPDPTPADQPSPSPSPVGRADRRPPGRRSRPGRRPHAADPDRRAGRPGDGTRDPRRDRPLHRHAPQRERHRGRRVPGSAPRPCQGRPDVHPQRARLFRQARRAQRAALLADPNVLAIVPDEVVQLTQTIPTGVSRVGGRLSDIAAIDGIGPPGRRGRRDRRHRDRLPPRPQRRRRLQLLDLGPHRLARQATTTARTWPARSPRSTTASASSASRRARACGASRSSTTTATA